VSVLSPSGEEVVTVLVLDSPVLVVAKTKLNLKRKKEKS
jgi:hypothetical protein